MRCLARLRASRDQSYQPDYHIKLQGLLYELLEEAGYTFVHDEHPFKFVSFSNIFPPSDMKRGNERTWLVASPHGALIKEFSDTLSDRGTIEVGDHRYRVEHTSVFGITPEEYDRMQTGTPIVVRIPAWRCKEYGIDPEYDDMYWRQEHPVDAFKEEIERNLAAKYEDYHDEAPPERPYFERLIPRKEIGVPLHYAEGAAQVVATTWEFEYDCGTPERERLMRMAFSAGVGEMNTTGFGFMNPV